MQDWKDVADTADCPPGKMLCLNVDGKRILLANADGVFYAVDDTCTHEDASLSTGCLRGDTLKCPLHGSRFDLKTGTPLEDPATVALRIYPVKIAGTRVWLACTA